ncbi:hypothetical protein BTJ68_12778 [Hortaea werneckii EXF-2000]|uniref:DUF676 domain-containing protein n=1 Tax=Hortaea werneckii EXF-2000 TaxID=1157616 RepID=A0A1Z5SV24_HORWE|nr:hypothetical protein BTJ68_12778 [Hortaea werneckii EXF-2000]
MKKTLLLVFIHGFKGSDHTFHTFPQDLRAIQYPQYETRGELRECVSKFKDWLQNKVIDLEVANQTPSPTVDPSVHVVLCGHSMGGIVAAETLLSIARDEPVPMGQANDTSNSTSTQERNGAESTESAVEDEDADGNNGTKASTPGTTRLLFPCVKAILAFDTPYLGISPGVLAHGAEEHFNQASAAYKAFDSASNFFGWKSPRNATPEPIPSVSSKGLPAADNSTASGWSKWGTYAKYGGAAAALAGAAGAAYMNRNQISQGFAWAGSHLEFVGCLGRGAELQKRVENVVELTRTHDIGFANFYGALSEKASSKTQYAGAMRRKTQTEEDMQQEMDQGDKVAEFADDPSKSKGHWVKCVNPTANDEIRAHTSMFQPQKNPDYHDMIGRARDQVTEWIDRTWYRGAGSEGQEGDGEASEATTV